MKQTNNSQHETSDLEMKYNSFYYFFLFKKMSQH